MAASGMRTAEEFELQYSKPVGKIRLSRGLWSRYMRGETMPQGALTESGRSLVDRMDAQYPGTRAIFFHSLWELLDFDLVFGPDQLKDMYVGLKSYVWKQFVAVTPKMKPLMREQPHTFWPVLQSEAARKARLGRLNGLEGLTASLIEARMGYLAQNETKFVNSFAVAAKHFQEISETLPFSTTRMRSALLLMEAHCVAYVTLKTIEAPDNDDAHISIRSIAKEWRLHWRRRCSDHSRQLSRSSHEVFQKWKQLVFEEM